MEFEYQVGDEKNFEGAPEWAEYLASFGRIAYFLEGFEKGKRWAMVSSAEGTSLSQSGSFVVDQQEEGYTIIAKRVESTTTPGPVVGGSYRRKYWTTNRQWSTEEEGIVRGVHGDKIWFETEDGFESLDKSTTMLLPLLTEEEKYEQEKIQNFKDYLELWVVENVGIGGHPETVDRLYDLLTIEFKIEIPNLEE